MLVHTLEEVARWTGENLELLKAVTVNSDNIDDGEMVWVNNGSEEGITTLTDRGIECLMDLLKDIRSWPGGIREVSGGWRALDIQVDGWKFQGSRSSMRFFGWPSAIASSVDFR